MSFEETDRIERLEAALERMRETVRADKAEKNCVIQERDKLKAQMRVLQYAVDTLRRHLSIEQSAKVSEELNAIFKTPARGTSEKEQ